MLVPVTTIDLPDHPGEVRVVIKARNERQRLFWLIKYYRALGADRFLLIDNDSDDGTVEALIDHPDVHIWTTKSGLAASRRGLDWVDEIFKLSGIGYWYLVVDADELLTYPLCEFVPLRGLTEYMVNTGSQALFSYLLDMYPRGPISGAPLSAKVPMWEIADHFDSEYSIRVAKLFPYIRVRGGPRRRVFYVNGADGNGPALHKIPLFFRAADERLITNHRTAPMQLAGITSVLRHYKFFANFSSQVDVAVTRKEHFHDACEYVKYQDVLKREQDVSFYYEKSTTYECSAQLQEMGLITASWDYLCFAEAYIRSDTDADLLARAQAARRYFDDADRSSHPEIARRFNKGQQVPIWSLNHLWDDALRYRLSASKETN